MIQAIETLKIICIESMDRKQDRVGARIEPYRITGI
jgi:hypothetical protein